jgi:hypothetical protein
MIADFLTANFLNGGSKAEGRLHDHGLIYHQWISFFGNV